ncbi:hypothetical protein [Streptosporangium canum]|uniref:hypothetical protein n=1 Tax=Streptosporangium canum TaxID=324952 RepID=UPI00378D9F20
MGDERRHCWLCHQPLRATMRANARYCGPACRGAAHRSRVSRKKIIAVVLVLAAAGLQNRLGRRCPVCGAWFVPGAGRRRDAVYDTHACRTAAWRARAGTATRMRKSALVTAVSAEAAGVVIYPPLGFGA